jgi:hypothetical protein
MRLFLIRYHGEETLYMSEQEADDVERLQWLIEDSLLINHQEKVRLLIQVSRLSTAQRVKLQVILIRELELRDVFRRKALS